MTKKVRFEVFKRDGFRCAYCGKSPPEVTLEVDHIQPKSKGGKNNVNNYLTACFDCNHGKGSIPLSKSPAKLEENLQILKEKELQLKEFNKYIQLIERRINKQVEKITNIYKTQYKGWTFTDRFKRASLKTFIKILPEQAIIDSLYIAIERFPMDKDRVIKYFCGICWHKIRGTERY